MNVLVIIPAFNEAKNLPGVISDLRQYCPDCDLVVINDGSTDNTREVCTSLGITCLTLAVNLGFSGAVQTGYRYAVAKKYDIAVQFDGDGQHSAEFIPEMINTIEQGRCNYVIGSRFVQRRKPISFRMAGSSLISLMIRVRTGKKIKDTTSGLRAVTREVAEKMAVNLNFIAEPDTLVRVLLSKNSIIEIPVDMQDRVHGESHFKNPLNSVIYMIRMVTSILFFQTRRW